MRCGPEEPETECNGPAYERTYTAAWLFGRHTLAGLPALTLIDAQHRRQRGGRKRPCLCEECIHVGPQVLVPQPLQLLAGIGLGVRT
jgi:hypothetical protein